MLILGHHTVIEQIPGETHVLRFLPVSQTSETLSSTQCNGRAELKGTPTAGISLTSSSSLFLFKHLPLPMTTVTMFIGKLTTSAPKKKRTCRRQRCCSIQTQGHCSRLQKKTRRCNRRRRRRPRAAHSKHRQLTVQISVKYWGVPARKLGPRDHSPQIGQAFLRSVPLALVSQIWAGCFRSPLETTGPELLPQNKLPNPEKKPKGAAQRRLLDWSWSQQKRGKTRRQLSGDCSTSFGHTHLPSTAGQGPLQISRRASPSFGHTHLPSTAGQGPLQMSRRASTSFGHTHLPLTAGQGPLQMSRRASTSFGHTHLPSTAGQGPLQMSRRASRRIRGRLEPVTLCGA